MKRRRIDSHLRAEILSFRAAGWTRRQIADHYGMTVKQVDRILDRISSEQPDLETVLRVERLSTMEQLDELVSHLSKEAFNGNQRAATNLINALRLKSELLGLKEQSDMMTKATRAWKELAKRVRLFAPDQVDVSVIDVTNDQSALGLPAHAHGGQDLMERDLFGVDAAEAGDSDG